ncbi:MAG: DUF3800 domain-containing protein [Egibacteraceae bacterium]
MLLAYVDESYNHTEYWIAALLCPERVISSLTEALDAVIEKAAIAHGIDPRAELHGHDLFQAKGDWQLLAHMPRARIGVYNDAFEAIASFDIDVILRGVYIPRLKHHSTHPDDLYAVVLPHLLERIDERAEAHRDGQSVLVIADQVAQADECRQKLWHFQRFATTGYRARQLRHIVDTMHFAPSGASRLVQAADLIAFLYRRIRCHPARDERAAHANDALWQRITPRVVHCHCWLLPRAGTHEGPAEAGPKAHRIRPDTGLLLPPGYNDCQDPMASET